MMGSESEPTDVATGRVARPTEIAETPQVPVPSLPSFIPSLPQALPRVTVNDPLALSAGEQVDDYQVIAALGRGAFGAVYLAWQVSLGRQIALKVSRCVGQEGRTLARLDHPHIVQVHSEAVRDGLRWLCMQYVPSIDLDGVLLKLKDRATSWTGQDLLTVIDQSHALATEFDPAQLADRQQLSELDHVDAVCFIVSRLASALAHAHRHGVLHRDIKAGNVLISQYGRPLLVDFNLAESPQDAESDSQVMGGTLPYMSPEHLDAFNQSHTAGKTAVVNQQSDMYSLGVLLFEMYTGVLPFPMPPRRMPHSERLQQMAAERRHPESLWTLPALTTEPALRTVLQRTLAPDLRDRWSSADEMAAALQGVLELRSTLSRVRRRCPWYVCKFMHKPFLALAMFGLVPHFFGSFVNIPYNLLRIVGPHRDEVFWKIVNVYNVLVYPFCIALCMCVVFPVYRAWKRRERLGVCPSVSDMTRLRRRVLSFPLWNGLVALLGWMPGAVIFPLGLHIWAGPLQWHEIVHFLVSFVLAGLIALTYSVLGVLCQTMYVFYPAFWVDPVKFRETAIQEMQPLRKMLWVIPFLAGTIPLGGAILLISTSPQSFSDSEYTIFRWLTTGLIALGMIGFQFAVWATGYARLAIDTFLTADASPADLTGTRQRPL